MPVSFVKKSSRDLRCSHCRPHSLNFRASARIHHPRVEILRRRRLAPDSPGAGSFLHSTREFAEAVEIGRLFGFDDDHIRNYRRATFQFHELALTFRNLGFLDRILHLRPLGFGFDDVPSLKKRFQAARKFLFTRVVFIVISLILLLFPIVVLIFLYNVKLRRAPISSSVCRLPFTTAVFF